MLKAQPKIAMQTMTKKKHAKALCPGVSDQGVDFGHQRSWSKVARLTLERCNG
jgi:hypothetical protein